jgi:hypothetical protein
MTKVLALLTGLFILLSTPTAKASTVPVYHHKSHVVYIESHAPSFPLAWAVQVWRNAHTDVDVRYGACRLGAGCAKVYQMHRGRHVDPALTYYSWYSGTHLFVEGTIVTKLDLDYPWTTHDRYQTACHEVGRDLGLEYMHYNFNSCMYSYLDGKTTLHPNATDIWWLNHVY